MTTDHVPDRQHVEAYKRTVRARRALDASDPVDPVLERAWFDCIRALHDMKILPGHASLALDTALAEMADEDHEAALA